MTPKVAYGFEPSAARFTPNANSRVRGEFAIDTPGFSLNLPRVLIV